MLSDRFLSLILYRVNFLRLPALLSELLSHQRYIPLADSFATSFWWYHLASTRCVWLNVSMVGEGGFAPPTRSIHGLLICCGNDSFKLERVAGIEPVSCSLEGCLVTITLPAILVRHAGIEPATS